MSETAFENWLHASDEERAEMHAAWDVDNDEGREIATDVAKLLKDECVYDVIDIAPIKTGGRWQILATAGADYDSLKDRDIEFLGFRLAFRKAE